MARVYETLISVLDKTAAPILAIEERLKHLGNTGHAAQKALVMSPHEELWHALTEHVMQADELFKGLGEHIHEMGDRLGEVLPMLGGLGAVGSAAGLVEIAHAVAEAAEALQNMSAITGVAVPQLQTFDYAAGQVGVSADQLSMGFERLNIRIGRAAEGLDKQSLLLFHKMGITLRDAHGHVKSVADIMPQLEKSFYDTKDPALRAAMAMQLFGRSGLDILPFLNQGPDKIKKVQDEFDKFGYKFSDDDLEGLEHFNESWKEATLSIKGLKDAIGSALAPVLAPLLENFAVFVAQNRAWIALDVQQAVQKTGTALAKIDWRAAGTDIESITTDVGGFVDRLGGAQNALMIAGGVLTLNFLSPLISLGVQLAIVSARMAILTGIEIYKFAAALVTLVPEITALRDVMAALSLAFEVSPIGAFVVAATALAGAGLLIYQNWSRLGGFFQHLGDDIQGVIDKIGHLAAFAGLPTSGGFEAALPGAPKLPTLIAPPAGQSGGKIEAEINFNNLPPGTQTSVKTSGNVAAPVTKKGYSRMSKIADEL